MPNEEIIKALGFLVSGGGIAGVYKWFRDNKRDAVDDSKKFRDELREEIKRQDEHITRLDTKVDDLDKKLKMEQEKNLEIMRDNIRLTFEVETLKKIIMQKDEEYDRVFSELMQLRAHAAKES